jgi:hypothetical protein
MKWLIWVPDDGETDRDGVEFDDGRNARPLRRKSWAEQDAEDAAEKYADEYWCNTAGEGSWPVEFRLRDEWDRVFDVTVDCEFDPSFSSGPAQRIWRGDEVYRNLARAYAPAEARR